MKTIFAMAVLLLALGATGQAADNEHKATTQRAIPTKGAASLLIKSGKPDQIAGKRVIYSGIAVQAIKADNPLQLINPAAPAKYGSGEDNVVYAPRSRLVAGLKIFSIDF